MWSTVFMAVTGAVEEQRSRVLPVDEGCFWGAAQSLTWVCHGGKMHSHLLEVSQWLTRPAGRSSANYFCSRSWLPPQCLPACLRAWLLILESESKLVARYAYLRTCC